MKLALVELREKSKREKLKSHRKEDKTERGTRVNELRKHSNRHVIQKFKK